MLCSGFRLVVEIIHYVNAHALSHLAKRFRPLAERVRERLQRSYVGADDAHTPEPLRQIGRQTTRWRLLDVVLIEPIELLTVEPSRGPLYRGQVERFDHRFATKHLLVAVRPTEAHEVVQHRLWQVAHLTIFQDAN